MRDTCLRGFGPVGTNGRQYAEREVDSDELMPHYLRHVSAMTTEGLHAKSAIAAELAWRDAKVAVLQARIAELEARNAASERDAVRMNWLDGFTADSAYCIHEYFSLGGSVRCIEFADADDSVIATGANIREAIDKTMEWDAQQDAAIDDAHAQGQAGEEKDG